MLTADAERFEPADSGELGEDGTVGGPTGSRWRSRVGPLRERAARSVRTIRDDRKLWVAAPLYALLAWTLWALFSPAWQNFPPYGNDSWTFIEISQNVFSDPGRVDTIRWFGSTSEYTPVPFVWPAVIAVTRTVFGAGLRSASLAAALTMLLSAVLLDGAGRRLTRITGLGPALVLFLLSFGWFDQELVSAGAIPCQILLLSALVLVVSNPWPLSGRQMGWAGAMAGLMVLTRFDALAFTGVVPFGLCLIGGTTLRRVPRYFLGEVATFSPWIVYSLAHFGSPWVSPYSSGVLSVDFSTPSYYFPTKPATAFDNFSGWYARVSGGYDDLWLHLTRARDDAFVLRPLFWIAVLAVFIAVVLAVRAHGELTAASVRSAVAGTLRTIRDARAVRLFGLFAVVSIALGSVSQVVSSSFDDRYWSASLLLTEAFFVAVVLSAVARGRISGLLLFAVALALGATPLLKVTGRIENTPWFGRVGTMGLVNQARQLAPCVAPQDSLFVYGFSGVPYVYGAVNDRGRVIMFPTNWLRLTAKDRRSLLDSYRVNLVYLPPDTSASRTPGYDTVVEKELGGAELTPLPCAPGLYYLH